MREGIHFQGALYSGYRGVESPDIQFLVAEKTPHRTPPEFRQRLDAFHREYVARGRRSPDRVRFVTYTTRYNRAHWVTIDGLGKHYDRADVDARRSDNRAQYDITTGNVTHLVLRETERASSVSIDGQKLAVKGAPQIALTKSGDRWTTGAGDAVVRKKHGLQGPIDDAFLGAFLVVRPTGTPWNKAAHDQSLNGNLPVSWTKETVAFGAKSFPAAESLPAFIYPNPMAASKYVVVNSGLTAEWHDWAGDHPMPQLGDFAVLMVKEGEPTVALGGLFNESWRLQ